MKIYYAGMVGGEFKDPELAALVNKRRLLSFHYMTPSMNQKYLGDPDMSLFDMKKKMEEKSICEASNPAICAEASNPAICAGLEKPVEQSVTEKKSSTLEDRTETLTQLGSKTTKYLYDNPNVGILETFANKHPENNYEVRLEFPEFTSLCPKTGQPDFAVFEVRYIPDKLCLESKSIKLYFFSYRNCGAFMETITNQVLNDFVAACQPRKMTVRGLFNPRGGLVIDVQAHYEKEIK